MHAHHPVARGETGEHAAVTTVRSAELLGALSTALDLTEGLLPGHAGRTCWLAMRLAEAIGLGEDDREALFYAALLKDAGCSSNAAALTELFGGDDRHLKAMQATTGRSTLAMAVLSIRAMSASEPLPLRVRRLVNLALNGHRERVAVEHLRCERGAQIALNAGFPLSVAEAVQSLHEHWDGAGMPNGLRGDAIPLFSRIVALCAGIDVFVSARGARAATRTVKGRAGTWYDPALTEVALGMVPDGLLLELADGRAERRIGEIEPRGRVRISDANDIDRIATAFADIVDAKSPFTGAHSRNVSLLAEAVGRRLGLGERATRDVAPGGGGTAP